MACIPSKGKAAGTLTWFVKLIGPNMPLQAGFCKGFVPIISISKPCSAFKPAVT